MKKTTGKTKNEDRVVLSSKRQRRTRRRHNYMPPRMRTVLCVWSEEERPKHVSQPKLHHIIMRMRMGTRNMSDSMLLRYGTKRNNEARSVRGPHPHHARIESNKERSTQYTTTKKEDKQTPKKKKKDHKKRVIDQLDRELFLYIPQQHLVLLC